MKILSIELPFPPSVNKAYVTTRSGRRILSSKGKEYKRSVASIVAKHCADKPSTSIDEVKLELTIKLHMETENKGWSTGKAKTRYKRVDASNRVKLLEDALFSVLGVDDSLVFSLHVEKINCSGDPFTTVELSTKE